MTNATPSKPLAIMIAATLMLFGGVVFVVLAPSSSPEPSPPMPAAVAVERSATPPAPVRADSPSGAASDRVDAVPTKPAKPKPDRLTRDLEREQIWAALGRKHELEPAAPGSAAPSESAAALLPSLDPEYVREAIAEQLVPVAMECYDSVLQTEPALAGRLVFEFTIIGDEEIGGVVEEAEIGDGSTISNEFLRDCLRESLIAVTFPPPTNGGRVEVSYPMNFEVEED